MRNFTSVILLIIAIAASSCARRPESPPILTAEQKQNASKEISAQIEKIIAAAAVLNVDAGMAQYWNDPSFRMINPDGSIQDYSAMRSSTEEFFKTITQLKFTTVKQDFTFINADTVICTWSGRSEFVLKDGTQMKIEPYVGSMVFKRFASEWKIIYAHETSGQPTAVTKQN